MKDSFFSYLIYLLMIILVISGMTSCMASAVDNTLGYSENSNAGNSSIENPDTGNSDAGTSHTGDLHTGNSDIGNSNTGNSNNGNTGDSQNVDSNNGNSNIGNSHTGDSNSGNSGTGDSSNGNSNIRNSDTGSSHDINSNSGNSGTRESNIESSSEENTSIGKSSTGNSHTINSIKNSSTNNSSTGESREGGNSSSSSSSSGMNLVSSEPETNIDAKELVTRSVMGGIPVRFEFKENVTCITYIEFEPTMTFRKTTTTAEVLKNKSIFVPEPPTGRIYKYVDIWVGDSGAGLPTSLRNGYVGFKIEKTWIKDNNANESMINLQWYDQGWQPFYTEKVGEDDNYVYYRAVASGFSCFAITEYSGPKENIKAISIAEKLQRALLDLSGNSNTISFGSEIKGSSKIIQDPMGIARILMAISLPMFLGIVGYCLLKKKI